MSKWISVKKSLPKDGQEVIMYLNLPEVHRVTVGCYFAKSARKKDAWIELEDTGYGGHGIVSHWMPLPDPPVED